MLPLESNPGEKFAYANMNYVIAGAMLERVGGKTWEELVIERIFAPLDLRTAGFGPQASLGKIDAPVGHGEVDGKIKAYLAGPNGDNPPILGPAGTAHMSVLDFARWAGWQAGEGRRGPKLVRPETLRKLHTPVISMTIKEAAPGTPPSGGYALGWGEMSVPWAPEPLLFHGGSNTSQPRLYLDRAEGRLRDGPPHEHRRPEGRRGTEGASPPSCTRSSRGRRAGGGRDEPSE